MPSENINIDYSVVIPVFNEEQTIMELYKRLTETMEKISSRYEIVFTDDGSKDKTFNILESLHKKDNRIKVIKFTRNFGHHLALTAGIDHARGNALILMDGDLQDPPEEILKLNEKFKKGYDIAYAVRKVRRDTFIKKLSSKIFYRIFSSMSDTEIPYETGIFRIISRRVADYMKNFREKNRFITAMMSWGGFSHVNVETNREERYAGETKYSLYKSINLAVDAITSFSNFPLRIAVYMGFLMVIIGLLIGARLLVRKLYFGTPISDYTSVIVFLSFFGGIQLIVLGIVGEYIGKIYAEVKGRPLYIIDRTLID